MMAADPGNRPEASALLEKGIFQSVVETEQTEKIEIVSQIGQNTSKDAIILETEHYEVQDRPSQNANFTQNYEEISKISNGNYLVKSKTDGFEYLAKKSIRHTLTQLQLAEFQFHCRLNDPNILHAKDYFFDDATKELIIIAEHID